jgi:pimeloyl-ACP methyl ester carboxylesterase
MNTHSSAIHKITLSDDYQSHYRLWGDSTGEDVIIILHGGMSHSAWQGPLAELVQVEKAEELSEEIIDFISSV